MSTSGIFVPPKIIFLRKNITETLMRGAPLSSILRCRPSVWIQSNLFTELFSNVISKTKPSESDQILLNLDGHHTHTKNLEVIDLAREHHVIVLSLPPHTTHKLHGVFKALL